MAGASATAYLPCRALVDVNAAEIYDIDLRERKEFHPNGMLATAADISPLSTPPAGSGVAICFGFHATLFGPTLSLHQQFRVYLLAEQRVGATAEEIFLTFTDVVAVCRRRGCVATLQGSAVE